MLNASLATTRDEQPAARRATRTKLSMPRILALAFVGLLTVLAGQLHAANCGNGNPNPGEQCDDGVNNGTAGSCCTTTCTFKTNGTACTDGGNVCTTDLCNGASNICQPGPGNSGTTGRAAASGGCDIAQTCTGSSSTCPNDAFQLSTFVCRAAANECDLQETCPGNSATCPGDSVKASGTACTNDGNVCTTDLCNGTVGSPLCVHNPGNTGTTCRAAANECDNAELCTGSSSTCPNDTVKASGTACTDDGNVCTTDQCNGTVGSPLCVHNPGNAGTTCRAATSGGCDVAETCTGSSSTCPNDAFQPVTFTCRASAGECDVAENCPGTGPNCPADSKKATGMACTDDGNVCTTDTCNGVSDTCQHAPGNAGTTCRATAGVCDVAETCTGSSSTCPNDAFQSSLTLCRASVGECDLDDFCPGNSANCSAD